MVLGHPGRVVAEVVGGLDLGGDARVHVAVRIGLGGVVGMRREQDPEFHAIASCARREWSRV